MLTTIIIIDYIIMIITLIITVIIMNHMQCAFPIFCFLLRSFVLREVDGVEIGLEVIMQYAHISFSKKK